LRHHPAPPPSCRATNGSITYVLEPEQAAHATTIAAVGKRLALPDHAVTVALAAALQESQLYNLAYGDRDSLGLFQQRPSQGWGTRADILSPAYAAEAFYRELVRVDGWETLPVTVAAQEVQRSAAPNAYARWEPEARTLASAATGETAAALSCRFSVADRREPPPAIGPALARELGVTSLDGAFAAPRGWTVATWLVAHAHDLRITTVSFAGRQWRASSGRWRAAAGADDHVRYAQQPAST
jgi:hypothetical protein